MQILNIYWWFSELNGQYLEKNLTLTVYLYNRSRSNVNLPYKKYLYNFLFDGNSNVCPIYHHYKILHLKYAGTWTLLLELVQVKCKNDNRKSIWEFIFDGNSNVWLICCHLWDICKLNKKMLKLWPWKWIPRGREREREKERVRIGTCIIW